MKVDNRHASTFIKNSAEDVHAVLIYGPDAGLVLERTMDLAKQIISDLNDPFNVSRLSQKDILDDVTVLTDTLNTLSITGDRRLVIIADASERLSNTIEAALNDANHDTLLILRAGDLKPRNKLRRFFEKSDSVAALACYADDLRGLGQLIRTIFNERNISCDPTVLNFIENSLGNDRAISRSELEKLSLFVGNGGEVSLKDAEMMIGDNSALNLFDLALHTADGDALATDRAINRCLNEDIKPIAILRAVADHLVRLQLALEKIQEGESPDQAMKKLRPPVFFKAKGQFRLQLLSWTKSRTLKALGLLLKAEQECKRTNIPDTAICGRTLHQVAALARTAR